jgi:hypothetical protein
MNRAQIARPSLKTKGPAERRRRVLGNFVEFGHWTARLASGWWRESINLKQGRVNPGSADIFLPRQRS